MLTASIIGDFNENCVQLWKLLVESINAINEIDRSIEINAQIER